jgi:hypothetical protein
MNIIGVRRGINHQASKKMEMKKLAEHFVKL